MPALSQILGQFDYDQLTHIAEKWGLAPVGDDLKTAAKSLEKEMVRSGESIAFIERLPADALLGLRWILNSGGRRSWPAFLRKFGTIREMGPGRIERERPDLSPVSAAEVLWYSGLIGRGFFDDESRPEEFVYIAQELIPELTEYFKNKTDRNGNSSLMIRKVVRKEREEEFPATDQILDHVCTLLAAHRLGQNPGDHLPTRYETEINFTTRLIQCAGLLDNELNPVLDEIPDFFDLKPGHAVLKLWRHWLTTLDVLDIHFVPSIQVDKTDGYQPADIRQKIIGLIGQLDPETWWSLESFIQYVKEFSPNFLRTAGAFDTWFVKNRESGETLRGFETWDSVEGAFLRFLICGPLHWLGYLDLAGNQEKTIFSAFALSEWAVFLQNEDVLPLPERTEDQIKVKSNGELQVTDRVPFKIRYQIARFCTWKTPKAGAYLYALTPESLERAEQQGLRTSHLISLLEGQAESIPPNIRKALQRWKEKGSQTSIFKEPVLRVSSPRIISQLQKGKSSRFLGQELGPTAVLIHEGSEEKVAQKLLELGYLAKIDYQIGDQR